MRTCATFYRIVGYLALGVISASTQEPTPNQPATTQAAPPVSSAQQSSLPASASQIDLRLPLHPKSVRFAVIGDSGTGGSAQYEIAKEMEAYRELVGFDFVIMLGDNIYGGGRPRKFILQLLHLVKEWLVCWVEVLFLAPELRTIYVKTV